MGARTFWTVGLAILMAGAVSMTPFANGKAKKASRGLLGNEAATHATSHFAEPDLRNAGAIGTSTGRIEGLGKVTVETSASWDWGLYTGIETGTPNVDEVEVHPCALMNTTPHTFLANLVPGGPAPWDADATVTITTRHGDEIFGHIVGGSVCELEVLPGPTTVNEGITSFEIIGGTGKFANASGSGLLRNVFNFATGEFEANEIFLHLDRSKDDDSSDDDSSDDDSSD